MRGASAIATRGRRAITGRDRSSGDDLERGAVMREPVELFVGQMIALLPTLAPADADPRQLHHLHLLFPRVDGGEAQLAAGPRRPRVYSLVTDGTEAGVIIVGGTEIPVRVLPLDVHTPPEATAFRVAAMSGRALHVRGVAEGATP